MHRNLTTLLQRPAASVLVSESPIIADIKPPLKWAGGKRWLVPHLRPIWEDHAYRRLVEPFCGGLAITLGLRPHPAALHDINPHLVNFYPWLRNRLLLELPMQTPQHPYHL